MTRLHHVCQLLCFPAGAESIPGLPHVHGGGQSGSLDGVIADAKNGYASFSINWGGNDLPVLGVGPVEISRHLGHGSSGGNDRFR